MKTTKSKIIIISLLILVVLIIVVGFALNSYLKASAKPLCWPYCPNMTDQDRAQIKESALNAATSNWKTYTNSTAGYNFRYPSDLAVQKPINGDGGNLVVMSLPQSNNYVSVQFSVLVSSDTITCYENDMHGTSTKTTIINGNEFHVGSAGDQGMGMAGKDINYAIVKDNKCYQLVLGLQWGRNSNGSYEKNFDEQQIQDYFSQILSTFKFTSP